MAASSLLGDSLVWKTTPKEPLPTIFALGVLHLFCLSGQAILDLFANDLCRASARAKHKKGPMDGRVEMASSMAMRRWQKKRK